MTTPIETREQAWERRTAARHELDFTMMYVAHDAFLRDLTQLSRAAEEDRFQGSAARSTWDLFAQMLQLHHEAEDAALWPRLRAALTSAADVDVVDAMEAEHAGIDPLLRAIDAEAGTRGDVGALLDALRSELAAHLIHEETVALPLVETALGAAGWAAFGERVRQLVGMENLPTALPWMLDGAPEPAVASMLRALPAPVATRYREQWQPDYATLARVR